MKSIYRDSHDHPRYFDPSEAECHYFGPRLAWTGDGTTEEDRLVARLPGPGAVWLKGEVAYMPAIAPLERPIWEQKQIAWKTAGLGEIIDFFDSWNRPHPPSLVADIEASATTIRIHQSNPDDRPVICSQAAVARWFNRSPKTTMFLETLEKRGEIKVYERRGSKYAIWFANPETHERALREISEGPKPRKA
jgi:hypothetical protein